MPPSKSKMNPADISGFIRQFQLIRLLLTAYELEIFSVLGKSARTSASVAKKIGTDPRATDRLLNALCVTGYLRKSKNRFSNTRESLKYLSKRSPDYMSGLMHQVHLWDTWSTLTGCVQAGTSVIDRPEQVNDRDEKWLLSFIDAMHYRARHNADDIIRKIPTRGVKNVLDIGGGSGVFSMAFVRKGKDINATVFDLPNVLPITKKYIRKEKLTGRIRTVSGDYNKDKLPKGFDLIFLSAIVHSNSYRENERLVKKCATSLNRGGRVIIKDQVMDDTRLNPARGALFALNMLVGTKGGDTYSEKEIKEWFDKAGIMFNRRINIPGGDSMMIGNK